MSNAAHAKTWQETSLSDPGPLLPGADAKHLSERIQDERRMQAGDADLTNAFDIGGLSTALRRLFDRGDDQFLWSLSEPTAENLQRERVTRVDAEHEVNRPIDESPAPAPQQSSAGSWLVIVERAQNLVEASGVEHVRSLLRDNPRTLLIALDPADAETPGTQDAAQLEAALVDLSAAMGLEHLSPGASTDLGQLADSLANFKRCDRAALVHLRAWHRIDPPAQAGIPPETAVPQTESDADHSLYVLASGELARRAELDPRIAVAVARADRALLRPWSELTDRVVQIESTAPLLLQWSAALALEGGRPFAFLSLQELLSGFGQLLQDICLKRAPVTLLVRPLGRSHDDEIVSSAALAGFRQLPHLSVMSPKDSIELGQMLEWCANQEEPALVWLPDSFETSFTWGTTLQIDRGRAESLGSGSDVAILAWGPAVAAATMAAQSLSEHGLAATVVNARFAQPLDREAMVRAAESSQLTVVIDDAEDSGGFSSWVLDSLIRLGIPHPIVVVAPQGGLSPHDPHEAQRQCARSVVDRCLWLSQPVGVSQQRPVAPIIPPPSGIVAPHVWFGRQEMVVEDRYDDQRQVLTQHFSPFIERWIAEYSNVGARDVYLWRWCLHGLNLTTLPSVTTELCASACDTKLLSIILCVLLDDIADQPGGGALMDALLEMASCGVSPSWSKLSDAEQNHGRIAQAVWQEYWDRVANYPCYSEFEPVLRYDLLQFLNTMRYSHLVNGRPYLLNMVEHDVYTPHNMMMVSFATVDLMCSPTFRQADVGALRECMWHAQSMGRIGNLLSTWKRELADRDFTSGVFARALASGDVSPEALEHADPQRLESVIRSGDHEAYFLFQWFEHRRRCHAAARRVGSCDLGPVLQGHDRFFAMHLGSRGLI
jgi:transketolase C-terminal domain/subunit